MNPLAIRRAVLLALSLTLVLIPVGVGAWYIRDKHIWAQERLAQLEPRYARLLGLQAQSKELQAARQRASDLHTQYVYPAVQDETQAGNQAQQKVRDIFTAAGLQVISSQVLPSKEDKGFDRIPVVVRAEGELLAVQSALAVLGSQQPIMVINELDIQVPGGLANQSLKVAPRLSAQFTLNVMRERS